MNIIKKNIWLVFLLIGTSASASQHSVVMLYRKWNTEINEKINYTEQEKACGFFTRIELNKNIVEPFVDNGVSAVDYCSSIRHSISELCKDNKKKEVLKKIKKIQCSYDETSERSINVVLEKYILKVKLKSTSNQINSEINQYLEAHFER